MWRDDANFLDSLIHDYTNVDVPRVWEVIDVHLPELLSLVEPLVPPPE